MKLIATCIAVLLAIDVAWSSVHAIREERRRPIMRDPKYIDRNLGLVAFCGLIVAVVVVGSWLPMLGAVLAIACLGLGIYWFER